VLQLRNVTLADNELADVTVSAACSGTVLLQPETLNRRWLTVWTAESANAT